MRVLKTAWDAIFAHRTRSALTMVGITIGIFSIYTLVTVALGATREISEINSSIYARTVQVTVRGNAPGHQLTQADITALAPLLDVEAMIASNQSTVNATVNYKSQETLVVGGDETYLTLREAKIVSGRNLAPSDLSHLASVALIDPELVETFFGRDDPLDQTILLNGLSFTIVGIIDSLDETDLESFGLIVPRPTMERRLVSKATSVVGRIESLDIICWRNEDVERVAAQVRRYLDITRGIDALETPVFRVFTFSSLREEFGRISAIFTLLLGAIGSVTLLVGGVGVMNIMLVSVIERTPEIGLRVSVGATQSHILIQFLTEAVLLCLIAGTLGILLAMGVCRFIDSFDLISMPISINLALVSLGFCIVIGLVSGVIPAYRAAKLNPVDALNAV